jgi:hypothetical protein
VFLRHFPKTKHTLSAFRFYSSLHPFASVCPSRSPAHQGRLNCNPFAQACKLSGLIILSQTAALEKAAIATTATSRYHHNSNAKRLPCKMWNPSICICGAIPLWLTCCVGQSAVVMANPFKHKLLLNYGTLHPKATLLEYVSSVRGLYYGMPLCERADKK